MVLDGSKKVGDRKNGNGTRIKKGNAYTWVGITVKVFVRPEALEEAHSSCLLSRYHEPKPTCWSVRPDGA